MSLVIQTSYSSGTMLDGGSLVSHSSQCIGSHSLSVSHCKGSYLGFFGRLGAQGLSLLHLTLWLLKDVLHRQGLSSSPCQIVAGATQASTTKVYKWCWKEWVVRCAQEGVSNSAIFAPELAHFLVHIFRVGLAWHTISIYYTALSAFFFEPHCHHKAADNPINIS